MYYIITFHKPTSADRKLDERFTKLSAAERWKKLVEENGYKVDSIEPQEGAINGTQSN